jgi:hypothetical protein
MKTSNGVTRTDTQFSVVLANKPNVLAQVCQQLADDKVNILALSMMDASEHGVLRLVVENPERARHTLDELNLPTTETTVLLANMPNRPGAIADVVKRLASNHVSVNYAYCTAGAAGGHSVGVFRVSDFRKAMQVLSERRPQRKQAVAARPVLRPRRT